MEELIKRSLRDGKNFIEYKQLVSDLLKEGKSTGITQNERFLEYSKLNDKRLKRLDKQLKISEKAKDKVKKVKKEYLWLVLTESWCGDAAHSLPILQRFTEVNPKIDLQIVSRDENIELMDHFLTNGSRSIPKLVILEKDTMKVTETWGPYPKPVVEQIKAYKEKWGEVDADLKKELQVWYNKDKGKNIEKEILELMDKMITA